MAGQGCVCVTVGKEVTVVGVVFVGEKSSAAGNFFEMATKGDCNLCICAVDFNVLWLFLDGFRRCSVFYFSCSFDLRAVHRLFYSSNQFEKWTSPTWFGCLLQYLQCRNSILWTNSIFIIIYVILSCVVLSSHLYITHVIGNSFSIKNFSVSACLLLCLAICSYEFLVVFVFLLLNLFLSFFACYFLCLLCFICL